MGRTGQVTGATVLDYDTTLKDEIITTQAVIDYLGKGNPDFLFIHLDHVDISGHGQGHLSIPYLEAISRADSLVGEIINATKEKGIFDETLFILSSDHGGINLGHGGETYREVAIPFILYGQGVRKGFEIEMPVNQYDNPATALFALGLQIPSAWLGRPAKSAFEGLEEPYHGYKRLAAIPKITPEGGAYVGALPLVRMHTLTEGGQIRFTLDGSEPTRNSSLYKGSFRLKNKTETIIRARTYKGEEISQINEVRFYQIKPGKGYGVKVEYWSQYKKKRFGRNVNPRLPSTVDTVYSLNLQGLSKNIGKYSYKFEGYLEIDEPGTYTFFLVSDQESTFSIDQTDVFNGGHYMSSENEQSIFLDEGRHPIQLLYSPDADGRSLQVYWQGPGIPKQKIPSSKLYLNKK